MPIYAGKIPTFTFATKPAASAFVGQAFISDVGVNGSIWFSNGTAWIHEAPIIVAQSGVPIILPSSGTIGNNGALSAITALPATFTSCYMYFPVDAIAAGVAAGLYYVVMSSTTAGTIYNNTYTSGTPTIPSSPTAFATTGPGAYTQTTGADITLLSNTITGGLLGDNGWLRIKTLLAHINNANAKGVKNILAAQTISNVAGASALCSEQERVIRNSGATNKQVTMQLTTGGPIGNGGGTSVVNFAIDTTSNMTLVQAGQLATATDWILVSFMSVEAIP